MLILLFSNWVLIKTHDSEFLATIQAFKLWRLYLKGYKQRILVFMDLNNLSRFMNTKSLSFYQAQ